MIDIFLFSQSVMVVNVVVTLLLIILVVVVSIFKFRDYYIISDIANNTFVLIIMLFLALIIIILSFLGLLIFLGWEGIGLMSFLLIGYWNRPDSKSSSVSAIMYNRVGDLFFIIAYIYFLSEGLILLTLLAMLCNSSLYLYGYWLPVAIEGPTPVSSLLHSSTIVVSGVWLSIICGVSAMLLVIVFLLSSSLGVHYDLKKNVAYSTSLHLTLMLMISWYGEYSLVVLYILLHGMVKGQIFQSSGYVIHSQSGQDLRMGGEVVKYMWMFLGMFLLSAIPSMVILGSKEQVVFSVLSAFCLMLVLLSLWYTNFFLNNNSKGDYVGENNGFYVVVIMLISLMGVEVFSEMNAGILIIVWILAHFWSRRLLVVVV